MNNDYFTAEELAYDDMLREREAKMFAAPEAPKPTKKDQIAAMMKKILAKQGKTILLCLGLTLLLAGCEQRTSHPIDLVCNGKVKLHSEAGYISFDERGAVFIAWNDPGSPTYTPVPGEQCTRYKAPVAATPQGIQ